MCLERLTVKRKLKKPMKVYGFIDERNGQEFSSVLNYQYKRVNHAKRSPGFKIDNGYEVGFHKCTKRVFKDAPALQTSTLKVFIIPAGTVAQYGYQKTTTFMGDRVELSVVVSPVLINPRIKPELSESTIEDYGITEAEIAEALA